MTLERIKATRYVYSKEHAHRELSTPTDVTASCVYRKLSVVACNRGETSLVSRSCAKLKQTVKLTKVRVSCSSIMRAFRCARANILGNSPATPARRGSPCAIFMPVVVVLLLCGVVHCASALFERILPGRHLAIKGEAQSDHACAD